MDVTCSDCGATVFMVTGWSDLDHCPACGRRLAAGDPLDDFGPVIRLSRESGRDLLEGPLGSPLEWSPERLSADARRLT